MLPGSNVTPHDIARRRNASSSRDSSVLIQIENPPFARQSATAVGDGAMPLPSDSRGDGRSVELGRLARRSRLAPRTWQGSIGPSCWLGDRSRAWLRGLARDTHAERRATRPEGQRSGSSRKYRCETSFHEVRTLSITSVISRSLPSSRRARGAGERCGPRLRDSSDSPVIKPFTDAAAQSQRIGTCPRNG
jgi:hypothetical protein